MVGKLQEGIYFAREPAIGNSFLIMSLKAAEGSNAGLVGEKLLDLWKMLQDLKKGIISELSGANPRNTYSGNLSILLGYGPKVFALPGIKQSRPADFIDKWLFRRPNVDGGGPVLDGSKINYATDIHEENMLGEEIVLQFIGDTQLATSRALVEAWKMLRHNQRLILRRFYTGFQRNDRRSLLGFHDGVSNMRSDERPYAITIRDYSAGARDSWLINGTYLSFMRIVINLEPWIRLTRSQQEVLVGRDKLTGCPLIGIDQNQNPLKDSRCPVKGTYEVIEPGNEGFRDHPPYGSQTYLPIGVSDSQLSKSHIARARHIDETPARKPGSSRIYRQGFEFVEPLTKPPFFRTGLNFVSYQSSPSTLFNILTQPGWLGGINFGGNPESPYPGMDDFLSVRAAGIYLVPPYDDKADWFPGADLFFPI